MIPGIVFLGIFSERSYEINATNAYTTSQFPACTESENFTVTFASALPSFNSVLFRDCTLLTGTIDFSNSDITDISSDTFRNTGINKVIFSDKISNIESNAFSGCTELTHLENFNSTKITTISRELFARSGIESIHVPSSVTEIFVNSFEDCANLETIDGLEGTNMYELVHIGGGAPVSNIVFPKKLRLLSGSNPTFSGALNLKNTEVTMISDGAFKEIQVDTLLFPEKLEIIGKNAFVSAEINAAVNLSETNVKVIGKHAFENCNMQQIKFPSGLRRIGISAFEETHFGDGHIDLSKTSVREIERSAFLYSNITSISFPATLEVLGSKVFYACTNLKGQILLGHTKLKHIPTDAFQGTGIEYLELPQSATSILAEAFQGTFQLRSIQFSGQDYIAYNAFSHSKCNLTFTHGASFCNCNTNDTSCFPPSPAPPSPPTPPSPGSSSITLRSSLLCFLGFVFAI